MEFTILGVTPSVIKNSYRAQLRQHIDATLGSGNLREAERLPLGEDDNEWLAVNTMDFFNQVNLLYATLTEFCTLENCPTMTVSPKYEYKWADGVQIKKPIEVSAPKYIEYLMDWIESQLDDESIFPQRLGQRFIGGAKDFQTALCKYAIEIGFEFVYVKNEKCRVTAVCSMQESKGCLWRVHTSLESANNFFYIRTLHDEHSCGAAVRTSKSSRMSSNFVASLIVNEVRGNPQTRPIDVVRQFTNQYGLTITYNHAWLGVEKARTTTFGDFSMSYDEIRWYMVIMMSTNPGFRHCRPPLFIDGTFLKGKYKGTLFTATAKDGDQE
ncbi:hypothetical protein ACSBR1_001958 [Camellia fascicularis]